MIKSVTEQGFAGSSAWARAGEGALLLLRVIAARPQFAVGYVLVLGVGLIALMAPFIAPYDPVEADPAAFLQPPSVEHWMGTDAVGMDILSRVIHAPRVDLTIALAGTLISAVLGSFAGAWVGYHSHTAGFRSAVSFASMRIADVMQSFPVFVFAIALVASLGQSIQTVVLAIAFVNTPIYLRLMRSQVMTIRDLRFVEAARVAGVGHGRIIFRHILPNAIGPVLAQFTVNIGWSVLLTAGLSFIGAGVRPPTPEWGSMIASGFQNVVTGQWWPSVMPGIALALTVCGFTLIGGSIETLTSPAKMRRLARDLAVKRARGKGADA